MGNGVATKKIKWSGPSWYVELSWVSGLSWYAVIWSKDYIFVVGVIVYMDYASIVVISQGSGFTRITSVEEKPEFMEVVE